jgi:hypothetical protein
VHYLPGEEPLVGIENKIAQGTPKIGSRDSEGHRE